MTSSIGRREESTSATDSIIPTVGLQRIYHKTIKKVPDAHTRHLCNDTEDADPDWWFASTAVPLLAATIGPLANVLSIAALVSSWRVCLVPGVDPATCGWDGHSSLLNQLEGVPFSDPGWIYWLNVVSLIMSFIGNIFLLFNFTGFVRYIISLPTTIIMWFLATGILIGITASMRLHAPPIHPQQTYSEGFWYAVLAAAMYLIAAVLLMANMLGYFLGHFPQKFELTEPQRTLILQTMMLFVWLAAGAAVFSKVESRFGQIDNGYNWSFTNALYFADVTILTVGFGDLACTSNLGRGLIFPYSVGGIIMIGLVISSISRFVTELGTGKVAARHKEHSRAKTVSKALAIDQELRLQANKHRSRLSSKISATFPKRVITTSSYGPLNLIRRGAKETVEAVVPHKRKRSKLVLLHEEKDRFVAMRAIEDATQKWKKWTALSISIACFAIVWLLGAMVFYYAEKETRNMTYFQALYFCYVSLLTIGYGDLAPISNVGRPFFVVWSLIAVPTMTILVSAMGDTVVQAFRRATDIFADFTLLPKSGKWRDLLNRHSWLLVFIQGFQDARAHRSLRKKKEQGFAIGGGDAQEDGDDLSPTSLEAWCHSPNFVTLEKEAEKTDQVGGISHVDDPIILGQKLAAAIHRVALDLRESPPKRYCYEDWVEFTKLIKFTGKQRPIGRVWQENLSQNQDDGKAGTLYVDDKYEYDDEEEKDEIIDWDWIGENSPLMGRQSEPEFVMDRLCESMRRYLARPITSYSRPDVRGEATESSKDNSIGKRKVDGPKYLQIPRQ